MDEDDEAAALHHQQQLEQQAQLLDVIKTYEYQKLLLDLKHGGEHMERREYYESFFKLLELFQEVDVPYDIQVELGLNDWLS